jgi:murein DD-endopeptidase MepM/ murein hydrolase activator NlpD
MKKLAFVFTLVVLVAGALVVLLAASSGTTIAMNPQVGVIGTDTPVSVRLENAHGVRKITAALEQDGKRYTLLERSRPSHRIFFFGKDEPAEQVLFRAGTKNAPGLHDGKARLVVAATSNDFRGSSDELAVDVEVSTQPPRVAADGLQHYINQGGAELVMFNVTGNWSEAGVRVGPYKFRSFPVPGKPPTERFSLFAYPWDTPSGTVPVVYARNAAGMEAISHFNVKVFPKQFRTRDLELSDSFLQKVVDQIDPNGSGDLVARFLKINGDLRRKDNQILADLRQKTEERFLWSGPFYRYGQTEAKFADSRDYIYKGKKIDHQTHLGFDLADVQNAPVLAANDGRVVYASDLGIYGNCIVVDHGYGLQSIYGHMSRIDVKVGDMVKKGQAMGRSGSTGLAGGDHIHFSLQIDGVQTNPVEWWDPHWIQDRILSKIPAQG